MAQSRLEKIGTIFTRVTGLLQSGAMKIEDKPLWYDIYSAFPPKLEPRYDRPAPNIPIRKIFYSEDIIRAKYHKTEKRQEIIDLNNHSRRLSNTQDFIAIYNNLKKDGPLDEEKIFETAKDIVNERLKLKSSSRAMEQNELPGLLESFTAVQDKKAKPITVDHIFND